MFTTWSWSARCSSPTEVLSGRALIEHNVFIDSDWDRERDRPGATSDTLNDGGGSNEVVRLIGEGHILRNNLMLAPRRGNDSACHAGLTLSTWEDRGYVNLRNIDAHLYGNVFTQSQRGAVAISDGLGTDLNAGNLVAFNVFKDNDTAVETCSDVFSDDDVQVFGNRFAPTEQILLATHEPRTVAELSIGDLVFAQRQLRSRFCRRPSPRRAAGRARDARLR